MNERTRLTKTDLQAIESRVQYELQALGDAPDLDTLAAEGHHESRALNTALDLIAGAGRVLTLATIEAVKAFGAPTLAALFIVLEADRVYHGVMALGQHAEQALLIAISLTAMNSILPVYRLRNSTSQTTLSRVRWTVRGHLMAFWRRLTAQPQAYEVDVYHNPALAIAETTVTYATLFLAFYAVLSPMLADYAQTVWYAAIWRIVSQSSITQMLGLFAGLLLSIGGVFGVQSISHELAARTLTDRPSRISDILDQRRAEYAQQVAAIRERVVAEHMQGKIADAQRAQMGEAAPEISPLAVMNGHKH